MKTRIALPAAFVCLSLAAARADDAPGVVLAPELPVQTEVSVIPEIAICTLVPAEVKAELVHEVVDGVLPACDLPLPVDETDLGGIVTDPVILVDPVVIPVEPVVFDPSEQPVAVDSDATTTVHLTGSEVQRGEELVDPSLAYATGGPAPEVALASAVVAGTEAATALRVDVATTAALAKPELTITRSGGDVIIGD